MPAGRPVLSDPGLEPVHLLPGHPQVTGAQRQGGQPGQAEQVGAQLVSPPQGLLGPGHSFRRAPGQQREAGGEEIDAHCLPGQPPLPGVFPHVADQPPGLVQLTEPDQHAHQNHPGDRDATTGPTRPRRTASRARSRAADSWPSRQQFRAWTSNAAVTAASPR